ncbi:hypothetical protein ACWJKU_04375 [Methylocaldum sp. MU1018]
MIDFALFKPIESLFQCVYMAADGSADSTGSTFRGIFLPAAAARMMRLTASPGATMSYPSHPIRQTID